MKRVLIVGMLGWSGLAYGTPLQFNRDVRPILSATCFHCHGPDAEGRKADLRFDLPEATQENDKGWRPIVPGDPDASEAWLRIISDDPDELMPPPDKHLELDAAQKATIKQWIEEGAVYERHWAFEPPVKTADAGVDALVGRGLAAQGLSFSPKADPATLLRRVYLDLTGLPPSPHDVKAFVADPSDRRVCASGR